jgi:hypothetical protein
MPNIFSFQSLTLFAACGASGGIAKVTTEDAEAEPMAKELAEAECLAQETLL